MKQLIIVLAMAVLAGCGVETATTAATGAAIKKQEIEEGKKTMERMQQNIGQAMEQTRQRAEKDEER
jgi:NifU-like protein involved in Fe-S cluster formation